MFDYLIVGAGFAGAVVASQMARNFYTRMFENMLDHSNISILLGVDYRDVMRTVACKEIVYTGAVDEFFDFRFGKLPYRSLRFKHETLNTQQLQPVAVI